MRQTHKVDLVRIIGRVVTLALLVLFWWNIISTGMAIVRGETGL